MIPALNPDDYMKIVPDKHGKIGPETWTVVEDGKVVEFTVQRGQIEVDWNRLQRDSELNVYRALAYASHQPKPSRTLWQGIRTFFGF